MYLEFVIHISGNCTDLNFINSWFQFLIHLYFDIVISHIIIEFGIHTFIICTNLNLQNPANFGSRLGERESILSLPPTLNLSVCSHPSGRSLHVALLHCRAPGGDLDG